MYHRMFFVSLFVYLVQIQLTTSERRFSPFRSAFRISSGLARNNDDDLNESHATLLPSATRSKPLQTTPFNMATTKKKIISTLLEMTENEISKKLSQLDENNEVMSANNKRYKNEPSTTLVTERSDSATSSLFEMSTEASVRQTTTTSASTTSKPRKTIKITTSAQDSIAAAEAAAAAIANMHSMHFGSSSNKNVNRVTNTVAPKLQSQGAHHHVHNPYNPYSDFNSDKINFDVNYRPTESPKEPASVSPSKKSKDKNRESVKNFMNGVINFVSSPLFNQAKPLIVSSISTVSNALSSNKNAIGSYSSSAASSSSASASAANSGAISKMFNSLRSFAVLRRNGPTTNASKNSKKKGKLNSAVNSSSSSSSSNNLSQQSIVMNFLDSLIKTREALLSMAIAPNKPNKPVNKLGGSSSQSNKNSSLKPNYANYLSLFKLLWKQPGLKQEARSI